MANSSGTKQGQTVTYDPYGNTTGTSAIIPDDSAGNADYGYLGDSQRLEEHESGLATTIEMGARQYDSVLGRFLETDPIEGGSANDYDYTAGDPINARDLDGTAIRPTYQTTTRWHYSTSYTRPRCAGWQVTSCDIGARFRYRIHHLSYGGGFTATYREYEGSIIRQHSACFFYCVHWTVHMPWLPIGARAFHFFYYGREVSATSWLRALAFYRYVYG